MGVMPSQITSLAIVHSTVYSGADQRKRQSSASLAFMRGIHLWTVKSPHKWPIMWKMFPFDDVIMKKTSLYWDSPLVTIQIYSSGMIQTISSANWSLEFVIKPTYKCTRNHAYWGLKNSWGIQSKKCCSKFLREYHVLHSLFRNSMSLLIKSIFLVLPY